MAMTCWKSVRILPPSFAYVRQENIKLIRFWKMRHLPVRSKYTPPYSGLEIYALQLYLPQDVQIAGQHAASNVGGIDGAKWFLHPLARSATQPP
jgi:hypothetical protein